MASEQIESGVGGVRNRVGGRYEDGVAAWFAVRILAGERAAPRWGLASDTALVSLRLQTAGALDDLQVAADNGDLLAAQLKRSLTADPRPGRDFAKTVGQVVGFCRATAAAPDRARALIVVGPHSSEPIRRHLPRLLDKVRSLSADQSLADLLPTATAEERALLEGVKNFLVTLVSVKRVDRPGSTVWDAAATVVASRQLPSGRMGPLGAIGGGTIAPPPAHARRTPHFWQLRVPNTL